MGVWQGVLDNFLLTFRDCLVLIAFTPIFKMNSRNSTQYPEINYNGKDSKKNIHTPTHTHIRTSMIAQRVKNLLGMQETQLRSLGWKDPLEEEMATHSSTLAWRIPGTGETWWATVQRITESDVNEHIHIDLSI